jgi:hypothetical protein
MMRADTTLWSEIPAWNGSVLGHLTPHHAFDPTLTTGVAVVVALGGVALAVVGRRFSTRRQLFVGGGATYATTMLGLWAGVRLVFWRFAFDPVGDAPVVVPVLVGFAIVIAGQFVLPVYLLVSHEVWTPLIWLFGVTWALGEFVLLVGGESSWEDGQADYVNGDQDSFRRLWQDDHEFVDVYDLPDALREEIIDWKALDTKTDIHTVVEQLQGPDEPTAADKGNPG